MAWIAKDSTLGSDCSVYSHTLIADTLKVNSILGIILYVGLY